MNLILNAECLTFPRNLDLLDTLFIVVHGCHTVRKVESSFIFPSFAARVLSLSDDSSLFTEASRHATYV